MPPDPLVVAETRAWLTKADEDLRACEVCLAARRPLLGTVTYHAQQAAEKAMKAWLVWHGRPFRKTHHLVEIAEPCWQVDPSLRPLLERSLPLSQYAWKHRYPGEPVDATRDEATAAMQLAQAITGAMLERLPSEVRPG